MPRRDSIVMFDKFHYLYIFIQANSIIPLYKIFLNTECHDVATVKWFTWSLCKWSHLIF